MITNIINDGYGWDVTCYDQWAAIGNPATIRFESDNNYLGTEDDFILHTETYGSVLRTRDLDILLDPFIPVDIRTGSVEVYKYNINRDQHDLIDVLYRPTIELLDDNFLGTEDDFILHTELTGSVSQSADRDILLDYVANVESLDNNFGISVDLNRNFLAVGSTYGSTQITIGLVDTGSTYNFTSSGEVFTYDLTKVNDVDGPYLTVVSNPNPVITESFGYKVSMNDEWLAVSSLRELNDKGVVYMYRNDGTYSNWTLYQVISASSEINSGDWFGWSIHMNKFTGSYSGSMIIGSKKPSGSLSHIYEFISSSWVNTFTLNPNYNSQSLNFYSTYPYLTGSYVGNVPDSFGFSVSIYKDSVVIGAPTDRTFYEYPSSSVYEQGAVYFFERCLNRDTGYYLVNKSYGNENTLKDNKLGYSVDIWNSKAVVGCPRTTIDDASICFIKGSLFQKHYCSIISDINVMGQYILYNKDTSSLSNVDWDIVNVYQKKKNLYYPYRSYGNDVAISKDFIIVGSPLKISGSSRQMDISDIADNNSDVISNIQILSGKGYIYNLNNLKESFHVGNVFYRNGKIVIMESGSSLSGLLLNSPQGEEYQYTLDFKSSQTLFEKQIVCVVEPGEFNVSTNPTALITLSSSLDVNKNGIVDFQDVDILLKLIQYKITENNSTGPSTDWSSSLLKSDDEISLYNLYSSSYYNSNESLFSQSFQNIDSILSPDLDINQDNSVDFNDQNILWKYFSNRLTQNNYEIYITPNSQRKFLSDIFDYLNIKTAKNQPIKIKTDFLDYDKLSKFDVTGSFLKPYVTTVGLYNGTELVAVAKLGTPIKLFPDFPINFVVKIDF
jgi:hypothetical protein